MGTGQRFNDPSDALRRTHHARRIPSDAAPGRRSRRDRFTLHESRFTFPRMAIGHSSDSFFLIL